MKAPLLRIVNWDTYQHYTHRRPPWIKLHASLLESPTWIDLPDEHKAALVACMILASRTTNGTFPGDAKWVARFGGLHQEPNLQALVDSGFVEVASGALAPCEQDASNPLAPCVQLARPERETEAETETKRETEETKKRAGAREGAPAPGPTGPPPRRPRGGVPGWMADALALGEDLPEPLPAAWTRWVEHLRARKKPTPGALQKHLADVGKVVAAKGPAAAAKLLDESIGANAQGLQPWAVEQAITGRQNGRASSGGRLSIVERIEIGDILVEGYTPGVDGPIECFDLQALAEQERKQKLLAGPQPEPEPKPEPEPTTEVAFPWH